MVTCELYEQTNPGINLSNEKQNASIEVEINVFLQNSNLLKIGATKNRNLNYAGVGGASPVIFIVLTVVASHSPSECGLAWAAIEEAVHRTSQLEIQWQISILPF